MAADIVKYVALGGFGAFWLWASWGRAVLGRRSGSRLFSSVLDGSVADAQSGAVTGRYDGADVTVRFVKRKAHTFEFVGSSSKTASALDVTEIVLGGLPAELHMTLTHRSPNTMRLGWTSTCNTGDEAFDRRHWVEGAPVPWIRDMLDARVREALNRTGLVSVEVEGGTLVLAYFAYFSGAEQARVYLDQAVSLARSAAALRARSVEAGLHQGEATTYRGTDADDALEHALDGEKLQAAAFVADRTRRAERLASFAKRWRVAVYVLVAATLYWAWARFR